MDLVCLSELQLGCDVLHDLNWVTIHICDKEVYTAPFPMRYIRKDRYVMGLDPGSGPFDIVSLETDKKGGLHSTLDCGQWVSTRFQKQERLSQPLLKDDLCMIAIFRSESHHIGIESLLCGQAMCLHLDPTQVRFA